MSQKIETVMTPGNFRKTTGIKITTAHNGKMEGLWSISTSLLYNKYCKEYSQDKCKVCSKCFALRQLKMYPPQRDCLKENTKVLTGRLLTKKEMPIITCLMFRFEAFGDLANETQLINYFNICKANKYVKFALWTKNPFIIQSVLDKGYKKPTNLQIVLSSHYLNVVADDKYDFADKIFTVFEKGYIKDNNISINCKGKSCANCKRCYIKNNIKYINEELK